MTAGGDAARAKFWTALDQARADANAGRWDVVIAGLEKNRRRRRAHPEHFTSTRFKLERRNADHLLAYAYASTGHPDLGWTVLDDEPVGDLLDDRLPAVDHSDAAFDGLGNLVSLLMEWAGVEAEPQDTEEADQPTEQTPGHGLLRILVGARTTFFLLRTVAAGGGATVTAVRRNIDDTEVAGLLGAFANSRVNTSWALIRRTWDFVENESGPVRGRMDKAFDAVAAVLREPLAELVHGRGLRTLGVCDDGQLSRFPFEALFDGPNVYFRPPIVGRRPRAPSRPRVLLVAYDGPDVGAERDVALLRQLGGLDLTVMSAADHPKRAILTEMAGDYTVVHFACHGRFDQWDPRRSALLLGRAAPDVADHDGEDQRYVITLEDVQYLRLPNAPLISLFACSSADHRSSVGPGYGGLPGAFLRSGASAVIGARWKVSPALCNNLTAAMYAEIDRGATPAAAFFAARRSLPLPNGPTIYHQGAFCFLGDAARETG